MVTGTGRHTAQKYATPLVADCVGGRLRVPLPYGTGFDRLRTVLATGPANFRSAVKTYDVVEPAIVDAATIALQFAPKRERVWRRVGITDDVELKLA